MPTPRKTIAVLIDHVDQLSHGYETELRSGFTRACQHHDLDLLIVAGRSMRALDADGQPCNGVYDLLHSDCIDGLVLMSNSLVGGCSVEELAALYGRYAPLPLCSAGLLVPGVPSVVIDNRPGMKALLDHLILEHGRCQIALLAGPGDNPDARLRFEVYRQSLALHGIEFDPRLVTTSALTHHDGQRAMQELLDRGVEFDAVVATNDPMAMGAADVLGRSNREFRERPSLVGFDDLAVARLVDPPLTTVRQPLDEMAEISVQLVIDQIEGREIAALTSLSAQLTLRQSCGCTPSRRRVVRAPSTTPLREVLEHDRDRLSCLLSISTRLRRYDLTSGEVFDPTALLIDALRSELHGQKGRFREAVEQIARQIENHQEQYEELQKAISLLRNELYAFATPALEDVWDEARRTVSFANTRRQAQRLMEVDLTYRQLLNSGERFSSTFDLAELQQCVASELLQIGIEDALFCLYTDDTERFLSPFLCLRAGTVFHPSDVVYPSTKLFPAGAWVSETRRSSFILPLMADAKQIGIAVFEQTAGLRVHDMLCAQVGGAIQTARLHRRILQQRTLHERALQERRAARERTKSLSALAGGVAHDLNNALGPLLSLPSILVNEIGGRAESDSPDRDQLRADLNAIHSAALRASQTIQDLLTLGRQGRTERHALDLNEAIENWHRGAPATKTEVGVFLALADQPLVIEASEGHLIRALANLVRNAIEAVDGGGVVRIETRSARLTTPHQGHELVPAGEYALLQVADTGNGIARALRGRLFEPFVTSKRISGQSGSGLGLAVVHGVVKEHGGFIDVQSERGHGTTFTLYFPLTDAVPAARPPLSVPPRGSARILVVDDDPVQLRTTRRVLGHLGYEVTTLPSGTEAYQLISGAGPAGVLAATTASNEPPFDLIVMDVMLNESLDGVQVIERIMALFPNQKAIITSGNATDSRVRRALDAGIAWLNKPYTVNALAKAVQSQIEAVDTLPAIPADAVSTDAVPAEEPAVLRSFTAMLSREPKIRSRSKRVGSAGGSRR